MMMMMMVGYWKRKFSIIIIIDVSMYKLIYAAGCCSNSFIHSWLNLKRIKWFRKTIIIPKVNISMMMVVILKFFFFSFYSMEFYIMQVCFFCFYFDVCVCVCITCVQVCLSYIRLIIIMEWIGNFILFFFHFFLNMKIMNLFIFTIITIDDVCVKERISFFFWMKFFFSNQILQCCGNFTKTLWLSVCVMVILKFGFLAVWFLYFLYISVYFYWIKWIDIIKIYIQDDEMICENDWNHSFIHWI